MWTEIQNVQWIHTIHVKQAWKKSLTFFVMLYMIQISVKGRNLINSNLTPAICTGTAMLLCARYIYIGSAYVLKFSLNFDKVGDDPLLNHSQGHISKKSCLIDTKIAWFQAVFSIMTNSLTLNLAIWIFKLVHFISMDRPTGPCSTSEWITFGNWNFRQGSTGSPAVWLWPLFIS